MGDAYEKVKNFSALHIKKEKKMFKEYCHIENSYQEKLINYLMFNCAANMKCVCTVKIDGSNFQVGVDENDNVWFGSRNREIQPNEDFQNWQRPIERMNVVSKIRQIKAELGAKTVLIYGELCGGLYRHPEVAVVKDAVRIQGRIDYSPDNQWIVFDALVDDKYMNQLQLQELCKRYELPFVGIKFIGTLDECLKFPCEFNDTTGHDLWGLPIIENNTAEGVVIKSVEDVRLPNGSRVIVKNKTPKYKERIRETKKNSQPGVNELEAEWLAKFEEYFTESRVYSVVSKLGNKFDFGTLMKGFVHDVITDFREDYKDELVPLENSMDPKDFSFDKIVKFATKNAVQTVRPVWLKVMADVDIK